MCGRYVLGDGSWTEYHEMLSVIQPVESTPRFNIAPTQTAPICYALGDEITYSDARWWFIPHWHKGPSQNWKATTFNAKVETAREKPTFRTAWKTHRCIVPATGYYEWTGAKGHKQPWFISVKQNFPVFFFAGLYAKNPEGRLSYAILTRDAEPEIATLHNRMPIILHADQLAPWLFNKVEDDFAIAEYGLGWKGLFQYHAVRPFGIRDEGPSLINNAVLDA